MAGAGAIGQWLASRLALAGHQPTLLLRESAAQTIESVGLTVHGKTEFRGPLPCITHVQQAKGKFDAIFLTCKAHTTQTLAHEIAALRQPGGAIISLQNGFSNGAKLCRVAAPGTVALALTSHGVTVEQPGRLHHVGNGPTHVGPAAPGSPAAARLAHALLMECGLEPAWHDDMTPEVWKKALVNHAVNPIAAASGATNGALLSGPMSERSRILAGEGFSLSRAAGVSLPGAATEEDLYLAVRNTLEMTRQNRCSMLQDVTSRRATELEQITGYLVRTARRLGTPMLESEAIYREVKELEAGYLGEDASLRLTRDEALAESIQS